MTNLKILLQSNKFYFFSIIFIIFFVAINTKFIKHDTKINLNDTILQGKIIDYKISEQKISFTIKTSSEKVAVNHYFKSYNDYIKTSKDSYYGKTISLNGNYKQPTENTIPNTFNYKKYLYNRKIYLIFTSNDFTVIKNESLLYKIKNKISNKINNYKSRNYLKLFILGNKEDLETNVYKIYQENGVIHLLAVSGMHVSFFIMSLEFILKKTENRFKNILIILFLTFYVFLTNYLVSIIRSFLMNLIKIINKELNLNLSILKIFLITLFLVLLINPFYIYNYGFLYSFIITFGIIISKKESIIKLSVVSFFFSLPLTSYLNYEINLFSIISNIICIPFVTYILFPLSIITFLFSKLDIVLYFVGGLFQKFNLILHNYSLFVNIPKGNVLIVIILYLVICLIYLKRKEFIFGLFLIISSLKIYPKLNIAYEIIFFDVNQGDSSVLISPFQKEVIMIDTGGVKNYNISDNVILYLKSIGITKIDVLVLSHGHFDHLGDTKNIKENLKVSNLIINKNYINELEQEILKLNINRINTINLKYFKSDNLNHHISEDENKSSLVYLFHLYNTKILYTGDITYNLLNNIALENNLKIDILKVAHHGSKHNTNDQTINLLKPKYAIITAGYNNLYKHPNQEVLNILNNYNVSTMHTKEGSVRFSITNKSLKIK